jgi:hypothetical protein
MTLFVEKQRNIQYGETVKCYDFSVISFQWQPKTMGVSSNDGNAVQGKPKYSQ